MAMRIGCVGVGLVGASWAAAFVASGHHVTLHDADGDVLATAPARVAAMVAQLQTAGRFVLPGWEARLVSAATLADAVGTADHVQESIAETLAAKRALVEALAACDNGRMTLGSSTSSIAGSAFLDAVGLAQRSIVVHPTNPPHIIPLVELCRTPATSAATVAAVEALLATTGHVAVHVRAERPGYVLNRLQAAVVGEALHLVGEGVISPEDLDRVMALGLAPRWALGGPFLAGHLNATGGYVDYMTRYRSVWRSMIDDLHVDYQWSPAVITAIDAAVRKAYGDRPVAELQASRDAALLALETALDSLRDF